MKAILINPIDNSVKEVDYNGDYKQIYTYIDATMFGVVDIPNDDSIFIDDEGLFKDTQHCFLFKGIPTPLCGKALVLGIDHKTGDSADANSTIQEIRESVTFIGTKRINHSEHGFTIETIN